MSASTRGFAGAMRRSELAALDVADVVEVAEGLKGSVARSNTDQEGKGHTIGLAYGSKIDTCPVRSWRAWLERSHISFWHATSITLSMR